MAHVRGKYVLLVRAPSHFSAVCPAHSKSYVASSFGWNPRSKKREMFDTRSRFVIARQDDNDSDALALFSAIVAYTIFRFDREEGRDVIYCYELQVSKHARRCGLGKLLTQHLSDIGAKWNMEKVMLTVFKANQSALAFYTSVGFSIDETSPDHPANVEDQILDTCDYSILSLPIP
ncbi:hypothetical protein ID866_2132 [Astraeus odoratus]|nr:hypothetical protein ID866_2132 [Astraeus odoratus]